MTISRQVLVFLLLVFVILPFVWSNSAEEDIPDICVSGIMSDDKIESSAVVNNCIVKEGEVIEAVKILKITDSQVQIEYKGEIFNRGIGEGCQKIIKTYKENTAKEVSKPMPEQKDASVSSGSVLYKKALEFLKKAKAEDNSLKMDRAYIYYDKAIKCAQSAIPLVGKKEREELMEMVRNLRPRMEELKEAKVSKKITSLRLPELSSPEEIVQWLRKNINYSFDTASHHKPEYWQTPKETITLKTGDCEDFSFLIQALLKQIGIESSVLGIAYLDSEGIQCHAVCIFEEAATGSIRYFSGYQLIKASDRRLERFIPSLFPGWLIDLSKRVCIPVFKRGREKVKKPYKTLEGNFSEALVRILK